MQSANTSPKKPSPLSFGSPRTSPFRRQESPAARSPSTIRGGSPVAVTPTKTSVLSSASEKLATRRTSGESSSVNASTYNKSFGSSPARKSGFAGFSNDPLTKLHPAQLHEMRESFQVLDRNNDGQIGRDDVQDVFTQLGQESSSLSPFFPSSSAPTINLSTYLNTLAAPLSQLSQPSELTAAFAAFDVDDSGQIDLKELRDALLHTNPEAGEQQLTEREINLVMEGFSGRRAFAKGLGNDAGKRGDVFRYGEFISSIVNGGRADAQFVPAV